MIATMNCTLNTKNAFAPLARAYLSFAQKISSSTHHHQSNKYLTAIGLGPLLLHKIASKHFQDTQETLILEQSYKNVMTRASRSMMKNPLLLYTMLCSLCSYFDRSGSIHFIEEQT